MPLPERKNPRLARHNYLGQGYYFVTLCCHHRRPIFRNPRRCDWFLEILREKAGAKLFNVLAYCIMPDHCHLLLQGLHPASNLLLFIKTLKIKTSRIYLEQENKQLWQHSFFEHILRHPEEIESVAWYIWLNPVRKGIASFPQQYSFAGSFTGLQMPTEWEKFDWKPYWR